MPEWNFTTEEKIAAYVLSAESQQAETVFGAKNAQTNIASTRENRDSGINHTAFVRGAEKTTLWVTKRSA